MSLMPTSDFDIPCSILDIQFLRLPAAEKGEKRKALEVASTFEGLMVGGRCFCSEERARHRGRPRPPKRGSLMSINEQDEQAEQ